MEVMTGFVCGLQLVLKDTGNKKNPLKYDYLAKVI